MAAAVTIVGADSVEVTSAGAASPRVATWEAADTASHMTVVFGAAHFGGSSPAMRQFGSGVHSPQNALSEAAR